ncbi:hypothetical protein [Sulfurimonas microaerophilic]|uniref:hypothetical protein n=1 Tax=Sulfurimonas microaerophilic TaxID=3058392 RepID=UPI0027152A7C|nr:hypothetical protein [Sulfurimonas sp. hsl 1-7]
MVKKIALFFGYFLVFILALIAFTPKQSVYYFLEQELGAFDVIISGEKVQDRFFTLEIDDAHLFAQGIEAAEITTTKITLLGVYNSIDVSGIRLASIVENFAPQKVENVSVNYSLLNPLNVNISANGVFGELEGEFSLLDQSVSLVLKPSKLMQSKYSSSLRQFKKDQNGEYKYVKAL